ncbi:PAS domain-containing sensor histidine kinase [Niabella yanshanensis]|uniref:histidine kinase n=1 Tax=Niabella yanshanensis TaxID=577386 RepID=A0ABZ0W2T5_9BACT|nr:PAS domain-containing sensor histidine kinase [Niabella yanshanensis]WQD37239.1 PAS domain-containing sensor histidine kinase [Niabella yanshanensis]
MHQFFEHTNEDQRNWIEALFDHATIGIVVTNRNGQIINFNKQAERDFGYAKEEVILRSLEILLPPAIKARHENYREGYYEHPTPRSMGHGRDLYAQRKDGSVFPVEVSLSSYTVNNELFVIAFVINITVRKHQEEIVVRQKEELEQVTKEITQLNISLEKKIDDRTKMLRETLSALEQSKLELSEALKTEKDLGEMKSKFVSMASHEFKTPLSTILSSSFLLEKYNDLDEPGKRTKHINRIKHAVNDMKMILDDFLSLDKLDEGIVHAKPETLSAEACFEALSDVVYEMSVHCKPGQQIRTDFKGDTPVVIDERLLKNICINLLSNAIKFSPENGSIELTCQTSSEELRVSVKDSGIGISEEDQAHLFERFFRAQNAVNIQGTGLGLNIVLRYIELMNGSIEFKSELEKGSVFTIHIPQ